MRLYQAHIKYLKERSISVAILSLLDHCYARGVKDACNCKDEMMCREFIEITNTPGKFGFLWKDRDMRFDLHTWTGRQFVVEIMGMSIQDSINNRKRLFEFLGMIINPSTYHFCLLHVAQEFYKQGMLDYIKNPNPAKLYTIMEKPTNMIWTKKGGVKKNRKYTLFRVQNACYDRALRCEEYKESGGHQTAMYANKRQSFVNFQKYLWNGLYGSDYFNDEERRGRPRKQRYKEGDSWDTLLDGDDALEGDNGDDGEKD